MHVEGQYIRRLIDPTVVAIELSHSLGISENQAHLVRWSHFFSLKNLPDYLPDPAPVHQRPEFRLNADVDLLIHGGLPDGVSYQAIQPLSTNVVE
jgi:hypothetical protein